jgi:hypothetical protein
LKKIGIAIIAMVIPLLVIQKTIVFLPSSYMQWILLAIGVGLFSLLVTVILNILGNPKEVKGLWAMVKQFLNKTRSVGVK